MQNNPGQPCEICGDIGYAKDIVTCSKCHKSREHIYCMNPNLYNVPKSWHCEPCRNYDASNNKTWHSEAPRRYPEERVQDSSKIRNKWATVDVSSEIPHLSREIGSPFGNPDTRPPSKKFVPTKVETGKVKYISVEDVCGQSTGSKPKRPFLRGGPSSRIGSLSTNHHRTPKRTSSDVSASLKCFPEKNHPCTFARYPEPQTVGRVHASTLQEQAVKLSQPLQGLKSSSYFQCKSSISEDLNSVAVLTSRDRRHISEAHRSPLDHTGHVVSGVKKRCEFENRPSRLDKLSVTAGKVDSLLSKDYACQEKPVDSVVGCDKDGTSNSNVAFKFWEEDLPNPPAANASWKGCFEILGFPRDLYDGFHAYPPEKISRKAYLVSKQMPRILQFTVQSRHDAWRNTFLPDSPSGFNIALYFLADDLGRSREKYNYLLEWMEKKDLSMMCRLDGVELLIFTSRQLAVESQKMNTQLYLWGVFRSLKGRRPSIDLKGKQHAVDFPLHQREQCYAFDAPPGFSRPVTINAAGDGHIAHEVCAPPGFSISTNPSERDSSSKVTAIEFQRDSATGEPGEKNIYDSDAKVGEMMHEAKNQEWGDSMEEEKKKILARTSEHDFHSSCSVTNKRDVDGLDYPPASGENRHMEQKKRFRRAPAYGFHSRGGVSSTSGEKRCRDEERRFPRPAAYDFHSNRKRYDGSFDVQPRRSREKHYREEEKRFPRTPAYKRYANALDVQQPRSREKHHMEERNRFSRTPDDDDDLDVQARSHENRHREEEKRFPTGSLDVSPASGEKRVHEQRGRVDEQLCGGTKRINAEASSNKNMPRRMCEVPARGFSRPHYQRDRHRGYRQ